MKIKAITKKPDWIRFNYDVVVEVNKLITAQVEATGNIHTQIIGDKEVRTIEDLECDMQWSIGGDDTNYSEFRNLYSKLFKNNYSDLQSGVYCLVEKTIIGFIENELSSYSVEDRINFLKIELAKCEKKTTASDFQIIQRDWCLNEILVSLGLSKLPRARFILKDNTEVSGTTVSVVDGIIKKLIYNEYNK